MEDWQWSWEEPIRKQLLKALQFFDDDVNDILNIGARSLSEVYQRSNVVVLEPTKFGKKLRRMTSG